MIFCKEESLICAIAFAMFTLAACSDSENSLSANYLYGEDLLDFRDGQVYKTVIIGSQTWMAENLNYNTNISGLIDFDPITSDLIINAIINNWCGGGNGSTEGDCDVFGRLYTWAAAMEACPTGWHLPSKAEWETLYYAVGGEGVAGTRLKSTTSDWNNNNGDDSYGFSALPAGFRNTKGSFYDAGGNANFWSATQNETYSTSAYYMHLAQHVVNAFLYSESKDVGNSVRCIKN